MAELKSCRVSYRSSEGLTHTVEVTASTLYEAAVLALKAFHASDWTDPPVGFLEVVVAPPAVKHEIAVVKVLNWLRSAGTPKEMVQKHRLKELLGWRD